MTTTATQIIEVDKPDTQVVAKLSYVANMAKATKIDSEDGYIVSVSTLKTLKDTIDKIKTIFAPSITAAEKAKKAAKDTHNKTVESHKEAVKLQDEALSRYTEALEYLTGEMSRYLTEKKRIADEAARLAEDERRKEEARKQAEADAEIKRLKDAADAAQAKGMNTAAETLNEMAANTKPEAVAPPPAAPKKSAPVVTGTSKTHTRTDTIIEITDIKEICGLIYTGTLPTSVVDIRMGDLKSFILDHKLKHLPGCTISEKVSPIIRTSPNSAAPVTPAGNRAASGGFGEPI